MTTAMRATEDRRGTSRGDAHEQVVLIVEDDPLLAELYAEWVADEYSVRVAHTATEAQAQCDADVAVVILDRRLRTTTAEDVLGDLRDSVDGARIALVTAVEPDVDIIELDIDEYITKPIGRDEFRACITRLLRRRSLSRKLDYHFELASKLAALETSRCPASPESSDEYSRLRAVFDHVTQDIAAELRGLSPREYRDALRAVNR